MYQCELSRDSFEPQGKKCTVSGWGHLKSKGSSVPDKLRKVHLMLTTHLSQICHFVFISRCL